MTSQRPLPVPPHPGTIPYHVDSPDHQDPHHPPQLLGMEQRPISVGSFGPSSCQTVPGEAAQHNLSEEQVWIKFYQYWQKQQVNKIFLKLLFGNILFVEAVEAINLNC